MPFANSAGTKIHYETVGEGAALVLHHGTAGSGADLVDIGYGSALGKDRKIILIDSRGHGLSDKPHNEAAYDLRLRGADVLAVMDALEIRRADYFGYSLGGWIGIEAGRQAPERFRSMIIGAAHPYPESMKAVRDFLTPEGMRMYVDRVQGASDAWKARTLSNDLEALRALSFDRASNEDALRQLTMSCLLFVGDQDPRLEAVKKCAGEIRNSKLVIVPGCDHIGTIAKLDVVIPAIQEFWTTID
jgi:pimeloyl-ACP methyl ester carboxylesterase